MCACACVSCMRKYMHDMCVCACVYVLFDVCVCVKEGR